MPRWDLDRTIKELDALKRKVQELESTLSTIDAADITFSDPSMSATDVESAILELKSQLDNIISPLMLMGA